MNSEGDNSSPFEYQRKNEFSYLKGPGDELERFRDALQHIADMDPHGLRADDLGRAASIARTAIKP